MPTYSVSAVAPTTPTTNDMWLDTVSYVRKVWNGNAWVVPNRTIFTQIADVTNNDDNAEETLIGSGVGSVTIPANMLTIGTTIRISAAGYYGSKAAGPGTLTIRTDIGGVDVCTLAHPLDNNLGNDEYWEYTCIITVRSVGAGGTIMVQGNWEHASDSAPTDEWHAGTAPNAATSAVNTTGALVIDVTSQFSLADAANTITCTNLMVELLN